MCLICLDLTEVLFFELFVAQTCVGCFVCVGHDDFVLFKFQFFFEIFGLSSQCIIFPNCIFYKLTNLNVHSLRQSVCGCFECMGEIREGKHVNQKQMRPVVVLTLMTLLSFLVRHKHEDDDYNNHDFKKQSFSFQDTLAAHTVTNLQPDEKELKVPQV